MRQVIPAGRRLVRHSETRGVYRVICDHIKVKTPDGAWVDGVFYSNGQEHFARERSSFDASFEPLVCSRCNGERQKNQRTERWVGMSGVGWCCATEQELLDGVVFDDASVSEAYRRARDRARYGDLPNGEEG